MTEIKRTKLNLSALKGIKKEVIKKEINQNVINDNNLFNGEKEIKPIDEVKTDIKNENIIKIKPVDEVKNDEVKTKIENENVKEIKPVDEIKNDEVKTDIKNENIIKIKPVDEVKNDEVKTEIESKNIIKIKPVDKVKTKIENENVKEIKPVDEIKNDFDENGEIFSGYQSSFIGKEEKALKESSKIKFPDSPKKIFFAIFTSLIILSSLALIIIFKVDTPTTNKLKINILEISGKKEKKELEISGKKEKKELETWKQLNYNSFGFNINYQVSNKLEYKVDGKIFNNKIKFEKYVKNKIEKLKLEKLKQHLQTEKVVK